MHHQVYENHPTSSGDSCICAGRVHSGYCQKLLLRCIETINSSICMPLIGAAMLPPFASLTSVCNPRSPSHPVRRCYHRLRCISVFQLLTSRLRRNPRVFSPDWRCTANHAAHRSIHDRYLRCSLSGDEKAQQVGKSDISGAVIRNTGLSKRKRSQT